jgi:hypothetical protein
MSFFNARLDKWPIIWYVTIRIYFLDCHKKWGVLFVNVSDCGISRKSEDN